MENFEDIKEGGIYDVRIVVEQKRDHAILACALSDAGAENKPRFVFYERTVSDFRQAAPENGTKNTEPAPKYDLCRLFRKGDIVTPCDVKGRWLSDYWKNKAGQHFVVTKDESGGKVPILDIKAKPFEVAEYLPAVYIELVSPVEELEPYFVMELKGGYGVYNTRFQPETEACHYWNEMHPHAKEAAEAERDRLNAEHRKGMGK